MRKLSSFSLIRRRIRATPFDQLSAFHCTPSDEQALPVRSEDEAESKMTDPVASLGQVLNGKPYARIGDVEYRPHPARVINPEGFVGARSRGGGKRQEKKEGEDSPKHSATPRGDGE